jgi:hypothetical protein
VLGEAKYYFIPIPAENIGNLPLFLCGSLSVLPPQATAMPQRKSGFPRFSW